MAPSSTDIPPANAPRPVSGLSIVLLGVGAIVLLFMGGVTYLGLRIWSAFDAPGSDAVRQAGCDVGQVVDLERLKSSAAREAKTAVLCMVEPQKTAPTCTAIAQAYGAAVPAAVPRFVVV